MKIYRDGQIIKDSKKGIGQSEGNLPVFNIPFFGPSVSAKHVSQQLDEEREPVILQQLTEELRDKLNFEKQKEPTWNINNPLKGPAKVAKNVGMFGGAIGIALINSLINDVLAPNLLPRKKDKSTGEYIDNPRDFDIRRIFFPNKFKK